MRVNVNAREIECVMPKVKQKRRVNEDRSMTDRTMRFQSTTYGHRCGNGTQTEIYNKEAGYLSGIGSTYSAVKAEEALPTAAAELSKNSIADMPTAPENAAPVTVR